jgi:hypothetical protein
MYLASKPIIRVITTAIQNFDPGTAPTWYFKYLNLIVHGNIEIVDHVNGSWTFSMAYFSDTRCMMKVLQFLSCWRHNSMDLPFFPMFMLRSNNVKSWLDWDVPRFSKSQNDFSE